MHDLVSEKALQQAAKIAPGWDKHQLAAIYVEYVNNELGGERPRHRDARFRAGRGNSQKASGRRDRSSKWKPIAENRDMDQSKHLSMHPKE